MSIQDKVKTAKSTYWITDGIPKWKVILIVWYARVKSKVMRLIK